MRTPPRESPLPFHGAWFHLTLTTPILCHPFGHFRDTVWLVSSLGHTGAFTNFSSQRYTTVIETYTKTGQIFYIHLVNRSCQEAKLIYLPGIPASDISKALCKQGIEPRTKEKKRNSPSSGVTPFMSVKSQYGCKRNTGDQEILGPDKRCNPGSRSQRRETGVGLEMWEEPT